MVVIFGKALRAVGAYRGSQPLGKESLLVALLAVMATVQACSSDTILDESASDAGILPDGGAPSDGGGPEADAGAAGRDASTGASPLRVSATSVDFGAVECGSDGAPKTLTLTNDGARPVTWSAALQRSAPFAIQGARGGVLAPGASAQLTLTFEAS